MDVTIVTSVEDFLSLRHDWERIRCNNGEDNFYYHFDWYEALCHFCTDPYCALFVLCVRDHHCVVAILPCWIIEKKPRFITHKSLEFIGNIYSPYRGGMVLNQREADVAEAVADFMISHKRLWDIAYLEAVPSRDLFFQALVRSFAKRPVITRTVEQYANIIVDIDPGQSAKDYWNSRKSHFRQHILRYLKRLHRDGHAKILLTHQPEQPTETAMDHYEEIYRCSWKEAECDPLFHRNLAAYLLPKGKLRLFALYYKPGAPKQGDDAFLPICDCDVDPAQCITEGYLPIATAYCAVDGTYAGILKTAYRQDYAAYSPGTVLNWHVIQWLLDNDKVNVIDFQRDGDAYKYKWGRFRDMHLLLKVASPSSPLAMIETLGEKILIPALRSIGVLKPLDLSVIPKPDSCKEIHHG